MNANANTSATSNIARMRAMRACAVLALSAAALLGLWGCLPNANSNASGSSGAKYKNAVYIYLCGSTLETKNAIASKSISDILSANIPDDTAVIIETGGTRKWRGYDIPNDALVRYTVSNGQLVELERESNASMGDAETLTSFLNFCQKDYSAENETFIFWNHGAGSIKGVCLDENNSLDGLTPAEIDEAFDEADVHFNTVGFDACLMANFETARVVANHADTMIASEEIEPALGWDYKTLVENLGSSSDDLGAAVLSSYKARCEENGKQLYTLSSIDLNKFAKVESSFNAFCENALGAQADQGNLDVISQAALDAVSFGEQDGKSDCVDLAQFAGNLGFDFLAEAIGSCTQTVCGGGRQGAAGISVFFPTSDSAALKDYLSSETNEAYSLFLGRNFANNTLGDNAITFTDEGSVDGSSLRFSISKASNSRVQDIAYDVYKLDDVSDESTANCLGFRNDVTENGIGEYAINFDGRWVALEGRLLSCEPIDVAGSVTIFSAHVKLNGSEGSLRFSFNAKTNEYALQGFVASEENGTQGRLEDLKQGDKVTILAERFKDNETLDTEFNETATVTVDESIEISSATLPNGLYQIYGIVTDIYGVEHLTRDFVIRLEDGNVVEAMAF